MTSSQTRTFAASAAAELVGRGEQCVRPLPAGASSGARVPAHGLVGGAYPEWVGPSKPTAPAPTALAP